METPLISIIIPTCNSKNAVITLLSGISADERCEIIVVDNASVDGTVDGIKEQFPYVTLIRNKTNRGAAAARNQGIETARGEYFLFLDADAQMGENFLARLLELLPSLPQDVHAVSPRIIDSQKGIIFSCGLAVSRIYRVYDIGKGKAPAHMKDPRVIEGPNSCCALFRKECLEKIKEKSYFDEDFFFMFEDVDLALRLKKKGLRCRYYPELVCYHTGGGSETVRAHRKYLCLRNRLYMVIKHNRDMRLWLFLARSFWYDIPRLLVFFILSPYRDRLWPQLLRKYRYEKNHTV